MLVKFGFDGGFMLFTEVSDNRVWMLEHFLNSSDLINLLSDVSSEVGLVKELEKLEAVLFN